MRWSAEKICEYLFYLLVFLLPWQTRYIFHDPQLFGGTWEYGRLSLYGWDILLVVLVIWLWPRLRQELVLAFGTHRAFYLFLLLVSLAFLTGAWATETLLVSYWGLRLLEGIALWLMVRALKPRLSVVCWSLLIAGTLQAVWGIAQFSTQATFASKWLGVAIHPVAQGGASVLLNEGGRWLRAYAGQVHPNVLGGLLVITSLATAWLMVNGKIKNPYLAGRQKESRIKDWFLMVAYPVQLVGLFVSFSRGAWLALGMTLCLWWFMELQARRGLRSVLLITAAVFVLCGSVLWSPTKERIFGSNSRLEQQSVEERVGGVGESENLLKTAWWRGVGLGSYTAALAQYQPGLRAYRYQPVHNLFLLILTELGVVGLGLFLWFLYRRLLPFTIRNSLFVIPVLVTALFDHYWWTSASMMLLFWLIVAWAELREEG